LSGVLRFVNAYTVSLDAAIIIYGAAATKDLSGQMAAEISTMWTAAQGRIHLDGSWYTLLVNAKGYYEPKLQAAHILNNCNPVLNFF
jgi:hypothetical protein